MRALVVVDYQTDFVNGTLGSQDAALIGDAIGSLITSYLDSGDSVFFTRDTHGPDYLETREGRLLPVARGEAAARGALRQGHSRVGDLRQAR